MNGNDDFFGGSATPPPSTGPFPPPGPPNPLLAGNKEYATYGATPTPVKSSTPGLPLVVGALVLVVAVAAGLLGYRALFGGTTIEIPQSLMGMERMDEDSPLAQQVQQAMAQSAPMLGDVDVEVGVFQSGQQVLFVMAGEAGVDSDDFFAGFEQGFNQSGTQGTLTDADPGPRGGEMKCITLPTGGTCAWADDDTFGTFAMSPMDADAASTAHQIRDAIEK